MRGVYKTTDGGKTWTKVLFISRKTGVNDLVMDPSDPNTLYAAAWERQRQHFNDPRIRRVSTKAGYSRRRMQGKRGLD